MFLKHALVTKDAPREGVTDKAIQRMDSLGSNKRELSVVDASSKRQIVGETWFEEETMELVGGGVANGYKANGGHLIA